MLGLAEDFFKVQQISRARAENRQSARGLEHWRSRSACAVGVREDIREPSAHGLADLRARRAPQMAMSPSAQVVDEASGRR